MATKTTFFYRCRYLLEWSVVWIIVRVCRFFPRGFVVLLLRPAVYLAWILDARSRKRAIANVQIAYPDYTLKQAKSLAWRSYVTLSYALVDFVTMHRITPDNWAERCAYRTPEIMDDAVTEERGVIVVTGHFAVWELLAQMIHFRWGLTVIGRPMDNPHFHEYVFRQRQSGGLTCLKQSGSFFQLMKILKKGGVIGGLLDQDGGQDGVYARFFGQSCSTHAALAKLAVRTGVPMVLICGYYEPDRYHFTVWAKERIELDNLSGDEELDAIRLVQKSNDAIEDAIREHPEQWPWMYNRFRRIPYTGSRIVHEDGSVWVVDGDDEIPLDEYRVRQAAEQRSRG